MALPAPSYLHQFSRLKCYPTPAAPPLTAVSGLEINESSLLANIEIRTRHRIPTRHTSHVTGFLQVKGVLHVTRHTSQESYTSHVTRHRSPTRHTSHVTGVLHQSDVPQTEFVNLQMKLYPKQFSTLQNTSSTVEFSCFYSQKFEIDFINYFLHFYNPVGSPVGELSVRRHSPGPQSPAG